MGETLRGLIWAEGRRRSGKQCATCPYNPLIGRSQLPSAAAPVSFLIFCSDASQTDGRTDRHTSWPRLSINRLHLSSPVLGQSCHPTPTCTNIFPTSSTFQKRSHLLIFNKFAIEIKGQRVDLSVYWWTQPPNPQHPLS